MIVDDPRNKSLKKALIEHIKWQQELGINSLCLPDLKDKLKKTEFNGIGSAKAIVQKLSPKPSARPDKVKVETQIKSLEAHYQQIHNCTQCILHKTRKNFVYGVGNPHAKVVFIGEAPGADEDLQGEPFVGAAGQLLNKILAAINLNREEIYICNILKCRPPDNRDPLPNEIEKCESFLLSQLDFIKPQIICALGRISAQTLLKTKQSLTVLREKIHDYHGLKLIATYHPAALLRYPKYKRQTWEDMKLLRKILDEEKLKTL